MSPAVLELIVSIFAVFVFVPEGVAHAAQPGHAKDGAPACAEPFAFQVLLDRRGFSSGEIDGALGPNLRRALSAFQGADRLVTTGLPNCETLPALGGNGSELITKYEITDADAAGPFSKQIPAECMPQPNLPALGYRSLLERLAERFHISPRLLRQLNRSARFVAGGSITVPAVTPFDDRARPPRGAASDLRVEVSADGELRAIGPTASNSSRRSRVAARTIHSLSTNGTSPGRVGCRRSTTTRLFWDADASHSKATIKPDPNNPVGVAWIDLGIEHFGIHGSPTGPRPPRSIAWLRPADELGCCAADVARESRHAGGVQTMMMRRRRSRLIHSLIAAFYAGGIAGWCLHATFAPGSTTAIRAPASRPDPETLPRDAPAATTGESSRKGSVATRARLDAEDDVPVIGADPIAELRRHNLRLPIDGADVDDMKGRFSERRGDGGRRHEAVDILAPRHTPVRAVEAGTIAKLFPSKAGGTTVYQFDPTGRFCYYYAHLQRYAEDLTEGQQVSAGEVLGYVGTSGNAPTGTPHLHFAIFELTPDRRWWEGRPLDPYLACRR